MISVEVKGRLNQYTKVFRNTEDRIPLNRVRLPTTCNKNVQVNESAEVMLSFNLIQPGQSNKATYSPSKSGDDSNKLDIEVASEEVGEFLTIPSWWPCKLVKMRDNVAVIKLQVIQPSDATPFEISLCNQLSNLTDIVNCDLVRQFSEEISCLTRDKIYRHIIEIPKELADFASDPAVHQDLLKHCGDQTSHFYDTESSSLIVLSTDPFTVKNIALLEEIHIRMLRQKCVLTRSLRHAMRNLEVTRNPDSRSNGRTFRNESDWIADSNNFIEKFYVPKHLMGLAIGTQGANIWAARDIPNVVRVISREQNEADRMNGDHSKVEDKNESVLFLIEAKTDEAAKLARSKLEFTELYLGIPRRYVARLIGRFTSNILSIIQKSGVVHIHFDDDSEVDWNLIDNGKNGGDGGGGEKKDIIKINSGGLFIHRSIRRMYLKAGSAQAYSEPHDEQYAGFILIGTKDAIEKARLLINFQMDYFHDLERMENEKMELIRSLSTNHHSHNNNNNNSQIASDAPDNFLSRSATTGRSDLQQRNGFARGGRVRNFGRGGGGGASATGSLGFGSHGRPMLSVANGPNPNYRHPNDVGTHPPPRAGRLPLRDARAQRASDMNNNNNKAGPQGGPYAAGAAGYSTTNTMTNNSRVSAPFKDRMNNGDVSDRRRGSQDSDGPHSNAAPNSCAIRDSDHYSGPRHGRHRTNRNQNHHLASNNNNSSNNNNNNSSSTNNNNNNEHNVNNNCNDNRDKERDIIHRRDRPDPASNEPHQHQSHKPPNHHYNNSNNNNSSSNNNNSNNGNNNRQRKPRGGGGGGQKNTGANANSAQYHQGNGQMNNGESLEHRNNSNNNNNNNNVNEHKL